MFLVCERRMRLSLQLWKKMAMSVVRLNNSGDNIYPWGTPDFAAQLVLLTFTVLLDNVFKGKNQKYAMRGT